MTNSPDSFQWNNLDEEAQNSSDALEADDLPASVEQHIEQLEQDLEEKTNKLEALQQELDRRDTEIDELSEKLDERDKKFDKLRDEFREKLDKKNEDIDHLEQKAKQLEANNDELTEALESKNTKIESLKATISALKKENESLQTSINKLEQAQDQAEHAERPAEAPESVQDDLLEVLEMLEDEVDGAVPYSRLIATAKNSGLPKDALDPALETLIQRGEVVEPFSQQYKRYDGEDGL